MSLHITGEVLGYTEENVQWEGSTFLARTLHLIEGVRTDQVRLGKDADPRPFQECQRGDLVDVEVSLYKGRLYGQLIKERIPAAEVAARRPKTA